MKRTFLPVLLVALLATPFLGSLAAGEPSCASLKFDSDVKEYAPKAGETAAPFTFIATNVSPSNVIISAVQPSCGCTTAQLPKLPCIVAPGSNVTIKVTMNILAGRYGLIEKSVKVDSSAGIKSLIVRANIPTNQVTTL